MNMMVMTTIVTKVRTMDDNGGDDNKDDNESEIMVTRAYTMMTTAMMTL